MDTPHTLTARTPADLLAAVPCVLGFHPEASLVMLTFARRGRPFHARVDLPRDEDDLPELCAVLLTAALRNDVDRVVLVAYTDDAAVARSVLLAVHDAFDAHDLDVVELLRVDDGHWFPVREGLPPRLYGEGVPFDATSHPFSVQSVVAGRVTHATRAELAATLGPDPVATASVQALLAGRTGALSARQRPAEARWVLDTVRSHASSGERPTDGVVSRLVAACRDQDLRDVAWSLITRESASRHTDFWTDVVRRTPPAWCAAPAGLLAFAAWLSGQGALAWCAVDRCRESDPDYSMADRIADILEAALPPHSWEGFDVTRLGLGLDA